MSFIAFFYMMMTSLCHLFHTNVTLGCGKKILKTFKGHRKSGKITVIFVLWSCCFAILPQYFALMCIILQNIWPWLGKKFWHTRDESMHRLKMINKQLTVIFMRNFWLLDVKFWPILTSLIICYLDSLYSFFLNWN